MREVEADPTATRRSAGFLEAASRLSAVLAVVALAVVATGCDSARDTTKAGAKLAEPLILHFSNADNGKPHVGGFFNTIFHGPTPFAAGDGFTVWGAESPSGVMMEYCVIAEQGQPFLCTETYVLPAGQIVAVGDQASAGPTATTLPVVGGTGAYVGAGGTITSSGVTPSSYITLRPR
jgi:hypothetical protein